MLTKTNNRDTVIRYLMEEPIINLNLMGILENIPQVEIFVDDELNPRGVLLRKNYFHYVHTKSEKFIDALAETFFTEEGYYGFSGVEEGIARWIRGKFKVEWESLCRLYYLPKENFKPQLIKSKVEPARIEDAELIDNYYPYRNNYSLAAIKEDILYRPSAAIYKNNEIASWVLVHDDNSMGIMHTKEEYRRNGYGVDVTLSLANKIFEEGRVPFLQIVRSNGMSPGLAQKCGFVEVGNVEWFGIVVGSPKEED